MMRLVSLEGIVEIEREIAHQRGIEENEVWVDTIAESSD
jgi:hypothetical protein